MRSRLLLSLGAAVVMAVSVASAQETGKIHGRVIDPTGVPKTNGTVALSMDNGKTLKYTFPVDATGNYKGEGITPGTYTLVYKTPEMAEGKVADQIDGVKIEGGQDLAQDDDLSRQAYIDKLSPEQKKQVEEFKKKNGEAMKANQVIKNLNADLNEARTDNKDKKFDQAEALMQKDTALKPDAGLLWYELGIAQIGLKKWDDAATSLKKAVDLATADKKPNPDVIGGAHSMLGEVYASSNKASDATAEYDAAAKANPAKAGTYYTNEAIIFSKSGQGDAQAAAADKAIAADPNNALAYYLKGQGLVAKMTVDAKGNYQAPPGCLEAYQKYLELAPTGPYATEVKAVLDATHTQVKSTYKAGKK
jgi:predicted Zn-dependent protease